MEDLPIHKIHSVLQHENYIKMVMI